MELNLKLAFSRLLPLGRWGMVLVFMLLLITAVNLIGLGVQGFGQTTAESLMGWVKNPLVGLLVGILATALVQSSGLTIALLVGLVAGGFSIGLAIPVVMGANIGTTVTNTLVSLGQAKTGEAFQRSFAAATVHDFFNFFTVLILFPLELWLHPLQYWSGQCVSLVTIGTAHAPILTAILHNLPNPFYITIAPVTHGVQGLWDCLPEPWNHSGLLVTGLILMVLSLPLLSRHLQHLILAPQTQSLQERGIWRSGWSTLGMGALITALVHSSSATTSLMVPLAGSGVLTLAQIYPFTLGANIGTCMTGLLVAASLPPALLPAGLQIGLVHLFYNCGGVLCFYVIPGLRSLPPLAASSLAALASDHKALAAGYVGGLFFGLPLLLLTWLRLPS
jgi:sodium-dependent phosphate cotransporter